MAVKSYTYMLNDVHRHAAEGLARTMRQQARSLVLGSFVLDQKQRRVEQRIPAGFFFSPRSKGTDGTSFRFLTFPHVSTAVSNQLAPAQPLIILRLPPLPFEYQFSNPQNY